MIAGLEARLAQLAALNQTTHYGQLARDLGLTGPATIARLTESLEQLMEQDVAAGLPLRAALVTARGAPLPAPGFFEKAARLGLHIQNPATFVADQRAALFHSHRSKYPTGGPGDVKSPGLSFPPKTP